MSTRETILAAIATALSGVAGGRVYRSRREDLGTLPAVVITPDGEEAEEAVLGVTDRRLVVAVDVYAKGDTPDTAADATLAAAWAALAAAPTLGLGTDVQLWPAHSIDWDFEDFDYARATLRVTYLYRTATGSM
jgi:hypothetical protein